MLPKRKTVLVTPKTATGAAFSDLLPMLPKILLKRVKE
jgi:hypothetical protein